MGIKCPKCQFENPANTRFCGHCATRLVEELDFSQPTETLETPIEDLARGSVLAGRYEIIEEIGKGGMGKVFKVFDNDIKETIALKLIRPEIATNKKVITRFQNEIKMARTIAHRNVCRMFDLGRDGDSRYITMEYVSGEDLKKSIRRMGPLTVRKTVSIAKQICHGLTEAHRLGVVHRDLKPHNIMIDWEGNVRIMDFGIALSQEAKGITDSNIMIGTPQYLSPEQVEGRKADQRSDIYSLGIIMFEMVTGQVPFDGDTTLSIAVKHKSETPKDPRELNALIPEDLSQLILKCMEKDPEKRYQSAEELCQELTRIEEEFPTSETTISRDRPSSVATKIRQEFSHLPTIIIIAILVVVVGFVIYKQIIKRGPPEQTSSTGIKWKNSVAVLVFKDLSPQGDKEPFCIGVTEAVIRNLHKFQELRVIPLTTVLAYRSERIDVEEIGKRLNVSTVLDGTLLMEEDNLRITTQLSSVEDGAVLWTDSYNRKRTRELELQDEISKSIAKALGLQLVEERYSVVKKRESADLKANESYKYGRYYELRYYDTNEKKDFDSCLSHYSEAVNRDPNFAMAYFRLGMVHYSWYVHQNDEPSLSLMYEYYTKAYEIDSDLPEVNIGLGWFHFQKEDTDKAYQFFKKAIEIDPNNAEISFYVGSFLRSIGLYEQAIKHYTRAFEIDPIPQDFDDWQIVRARCYSFSGRFEEAADYIEKALKIRPSHRLHFEYAFQLIMMKKYEEAEIQIAHAEEHDPDDAVLNLYRAWLFAAKGQKKKSLDLIPDEFSPILYHITSTYALLGMKDEAIDKIAEGIETGFKVYEEYLYPYAYLVSNPFYDVLRDDPRFEEILRKEKLKSEEKLKRYGDL